MSQKPTPQKIVRSRVSSGIPWWIWGLLLLIGGGIVTSLFVRSIPEDPAKIFADALAAAEKRDGEALQANFAKLKEFPDYASQIKLLEGMTLLGRSRPLAAIPILEKAAEDKAIRDKALMYLGTAYGQAENWKKANEVFERILAEDENAHSARQNLALILTESFAWDEALVQLNMLIEKDFKPAQIRKMRADIYFDQKKYKEAADDLQASLEADKTDPTNSVKADKLVRCLSKLGEFERAEKFLSSLDQSSSLDALRAEKFLAEDNLAGVLSAVQSVRRESPNEPRVNRAFGRAMLKMNSSEKSREALVTLKNVIQVASRDLELYQIVVELARSAGNEELAQLAQQNVDQLTELHRQYDETLAAVTKTREGFDIRLKLAELAANTGQFEMASRLLEHLERTYPDQANNVHEMKQRLYSSLSQLVSTTTASDLAAEAAKGAENPASSATPDEKASDEKSPDEKTPAETSPEKPAEPKPDESKPEEPKADAPAEDAPATDAPATDAPKADEAKPEPAEADDASATPQPEAEKPDATDADTPEPK